MFVYDLFFYFKPDFEDYIALKECSETEYWLELLSESGYYHNKTILDRFL